MQATTTTGHPPTTQVPSSISLSLRSIDDDNVLSTFALPIHTTQDLHIFLLHIIRINNYFPLEHRLAPLLSCFALLDYRTRSLVVPYHGDALLGVIYRSNKKRRIQSTQRRVEFRRVESIDSLFVSPVIP